MDRITITVRSEINLPLNKVWKLWTTPEDIINWNFASDDWHTPEAVNDLRIGGSFKYRMEAKDGSFGFDFGGVYSKVILNKYIGYTIGDGRRVEISFVEKENKTEIIESFDAENTNPAELQQKGWQSILDNFKKYAESKS